MLHIHTSNQLEQLANRFAVIVESPLKNVFATEMVVVQNAGMGRYLSMNTADITGLSANTEYLFPAEFMWRLLRLVSPEIPEKSQCTPQTMRFHIMQELTNNTADYPELHHYILNREDQNKIDEEATWALSCELSQLLDQYLFYRSDWIRDWQESGEAFEKKNWQERLWQRCVEDNKLIHWLTLQDQFRHSLDEIDTSILPERISFFSMSSLSPGYIDLLGELGKKIELHVFVMNPCEDIYWGDISSEKSKAKRPLEEQVYSDVGNPLLASMGKQGRDFIHQLLSLQNVESQKLRVDESNSKPVTTLLNKLQTDIFLLHTPPLSEGFSATTDHSIRINSCHTPMREVEVLYDQILDALESDTSLAPSDIVVMMPDIEKYAAYIEAVFSQPVHTNSHQKLPFSIADRDPLIVHSLIEALLKTFTLTDKRFDVESVFELLDYETIRKQFTLNETQVEYCRELARATNIRWGINAKTRKQKQLPNTEEHTWKYALDRLLLGYMMGEHPDKEHLLQTDSKNADLPILPYTDIEGSDAITLANFKRFTDCLFIVNKWQNKQQTLSTWVDDIKQFLQLLFGESQDIAKILIAIDELQTTAEFVVFEQKISYSVFNKMLTDALQNISAIESYLGHGITFCALVPMRSVPFKLVALMGMNDGEFPRQDKHHSFDLMKNNGRRGDRSRREEDRYLFLESLLATRSRLIISYIGQNVKDNQPLPPSILLSELLDTLETYTEIEPKNWVCKHPLQAFSPRYFDPASPLFSYAQEYTKIQNKLGNDAPSQVFISERLAELDVKYKNVSLQDLISFFKSPARVFLKQRFSIQTFDDAVTLPIREPFELEFFKDRDVRKLALEESLNEKERILIARAKGLLPYADIGEQVYQKEAGIIQRFKNKLPDFEGHEPQHFTLLLGEFSLEGKLDQITELGHVSESLSQPYFRDYIDVWLHHLVLNATSGDTAKHSYFYSPETSYSLRPVTNAQEQLQQLLDYYWHGLHFPLAFFPNTAFAMYKKNKQGNPKDASTKWNGDTQCAGDKDKFENWLLHRSIDFDEHNLPDEFLETAQLIFGEMFSLLEDI